MSIGQVYLDAVLEPSRSLSPKGFNRVMLGLGALGFVVGATFLLTGAYPVVGFMGLEFLALWLAFKASFRAQAARTYVQVTADAVTVRKIDGWGRERHAELSSHFVRVELDSAVRGPGALRLAASDKVYPLGEFLTPRERESFARRLDAALSDARRERFYGDRNER